MIKPRRSWKATLAIVFAMVLVTGHTMACMESPMSFSPSGDLAVTVVDAEESLELEEVGSALFRVMIVRKDGKLREIERSNSHLLSAPAYSPDGKRIAYLRIPQLTREDMQRINRLHEEAIVVVPPDELVVPPDEEETEGVAIEAAGPKWIPVGPGHPPDMEERATTEEPSGNDETTDVDIPGQALIETDGGFTMNWNHLARSISDEPSITEFEVSEGGGYVLAHLVVRDAFTGDEVDEVPLEMPVSEPGYWGLTYGFAKPVFSPDGRDVYFAAMGFAQVTNLETREHAFLGAALAVTLSPDGEILAELRAAPIALRDTEGSRVTYFDPSHEAAASPSSLTWADNDTLLVLGRGQADEMYLDAYDATGKVTDSKRIGEVPYEGIIEFALSPDGQYLTVIDEEAVRFMSNEFALLGRFEYDKDSEYFSSPAYTPDSRSVAMKHVVSLSEDDSDQEIQRVDAVLYFTPEGRELFRVDVPEVSREEWLLPEERQDPPGTDLPRTEAAKP